MIGPFNYGPGNKEFEDRPKPALVEATDAVVRMTRTIICGTDLQVFKEDLLPPS